MPYCFYTILYIVLLHSTVDKDIFFRKVLLTCFPLCLLGNSIANEHLLLNTKTFIMSNN